VRRKYQKVITLAESSLLGISLSSKSMPDMGISALIGFIEILDELISTLLGSRVRERKVKGEVGGLRGLDNVRNRSFVGAV
jgi:hypothetical protein